jgi:hypothetical protein
LATPEYNASDFWPEVAVFEEEAVRGFFASYEILRFNVHKSSGKTPSGNLHDWHVYSVIARKPG